MKNIKKPLKYLVCIFLSTFLFLSPYLYISWIENDITWLLKQDWSESRFRTVIIIELLHSIGLAILSIPITEIILKD